MYLWIVYLHILGAFIFLMAHGVSVLMAFRLRSERSVERVRALLDLSAMSYGAMFSGLGVLLVAGVIAGFIGDWWGRGWIWVSLGLLVLIAGLMTPLGSSKYGAVRKAVGLPYFDRGKPHPADAPASDDEVATLLDGVNPIPLAAVGLIGLAIIVWLMMFKPF